jgi:hypothetical protein
MIRIDLDWKEFASRHSKSNLSKEPEREEESNEGGDSGDDATTPAKWPGDLANLKETRRVETKIQTKRKQRAEAASLRLVGVSRSWLAPWLCLSEAKYG